MWTNVMLQGKLCIPRYLFILSRPPCRITLFYSLNCELSFDLVFKRNTKYLKRENALKERPSLKKRGLVLKMPIEIIYCHIAVSGTLTLF